MNHRSNTKYREKYIRPRALIISAPETARAVKMLYAAQKLIARIFSNFMTFPDFYSSKTEVANLFS